MYNYGSESPPLTTKNGLTIHITFKGKKKEKIISKLTTEHEMFINKLNILRLACITIVKTHIGYKTSENLNFADIVSIVKNRSYFHQQVGEKTIFYSPDPKRSVFHSCSYLHQ